METKLELSFRRFLGCESPLSPLRKTPMSKTKTCCGYRFLILTWIGASLLSLPACGGSGGVAPPVPMIQASNFSPSIDHPYFPMQQGIVLNYEGTEDGLPRREDVRVTEDRRIIMGIDCSSMRENVYVDDVLVEVTTHWYAQDNAGNVWKFGEESWELALGELVLADDSWVADGVDALPWREFVANPHVGDVFVGYRPGGIDTFHIVSTTAAVSVPAGDFTDCVEVHENPDDPEDADIILYSRGVGRVAEFSTNGDLELVSIQSTP